MSVHSFSAQTIDGKTQPLSAFAGQVLLIVNTASRCGLTPQYAGLEPLYRRYKNRGFAVLGFPCNQFMEQEPGTDAEIAAFCSSQYGVSFPMFAKIEVNGPGAHPLYVYLKENAPGNQGDIEWNFAKFLIDGNGKVVKRYEPRTEPEQLAADIEALLAE